ncbi:major facilitator superfamily domain-containing protein [Phyllosticta capitalensis]
MRTSLARSVSVLLSTAGPTRSNSKSTVNSTTPTEETPTPRIEVVIPTPQLDIPLHDDNDDDGLVKPSRAYRIHDIEKTSSDAGLFPASSSVYSSARGYSPSISGGGAAVRAPDGGGVAWATALAGFLVAFNCWGLNFAFGVLEPWYRSSLLASEPASKIAWIGSTQMAFLFLVAPLASVLYDYGHFRLLFNGGSVLLLGACLATSWCRSWVTLFVAQGLVTGVANGLVFCSGVRVLLGLFDKRIGLAMGIGAMGASAGGVVFTLAVQHLLPEMGFGSTYRVLALIVLVTMLFPTLVVKPWEGERRAAKEKVRLSVVLLDGAFWVMVLGMFCAFWGLYFGYYYVSPPLPLTPLIHPYLPPSQSNAIQLTFFLSLQITSYAASSLHLSPSSSSSAQSPTNYLLTMLACNLPGRLLPALLSDAYSGPLNALVPCALASAALLFGYIPAASSSAALYVVSALYGFASGGIMSLYAAVGRQWGAGGAVRSEKAGGDEDVESTRDGDAEVGCARGTRAAPSTPNGSCDPGSYVNHSTPRPSTTNTTTNATTVTHATHIPNFEILNAPSYPSHPPINPANPPSTTSATAPLRTTIILVAAGLAALSGPPLGGHLLDRGLAAEGDGPAGYVAALAWAGGSMGMAGLLFAVSRVLRVGWGWGRA